MQINNHLVSEIVLNIEYVTQKVSVNRHSLAQPIQTAVMLKDTLCHVVYIQSLEVRRGEALLELLPEVKERVETVWDQDVL